MKSFCRYYRQIIQLQLLCSDIPNLILSLWYRGSKSNIPCCVLLDITFGPLSLIAAELCKRFLYVTIGKIWENVHLKWQFTLPIASAVNLFNVKLPLSLHHRLNAFDISSQFNSNDNLFDIRIYNFSAVSGLSGPEPIYMYTSCDQVTWIIHSGGFLIILLLT
jgi:hypothetical protein